MRMLIKCMVLLWACKSIEEYDFLDDDNEEDCNNNDESCSALSYRLAEKEPDAARILQVNREDSIIVL